MNGIGSARVIVVLLVVASFAVAACSLGRPSRALDNTSWTLETVSGTRVSLPEPPTLVFTTGGAFHGFAGCNDFFGDAVITEGSIKIESIGATARGCDGPKAAPIEADYLEALQAAEGWSVDGGKLTVGGPTTSPLTFVKR